MATYHCSFRHGGVGRGVAHANYICREGKYGSARMKEQLVYQESGNMPAFAQADPHDYWRAADAYTRMNGRVYEEIEVALPQELSHEENIALVRSFIVQELGTQHAYTFAVHDKPAANDPTQRQVHAHIMFSPKIQDGIERSREHFFKRYNSRHPELGGAKNDVRFSSMQGKKSLALVREHWEQLLNRAYEERGLAQRVSAKSLRAQRAEALAKGESEKAYVLDRLPQEHLGPKLTYTTLREAAKAVDKEKFYLEQAHPKARHNFLARRQVELAQEIVMLRRERILTLRENLENKRNVKALQQAMHTQLLDTPTMAEKAQAARQLGLDLRAQLTLAQQELRAAQRELTAFRQTNYILSEEQIRRAANNIYTKGQTKLLRQRALNCQKMQAAMQELQQQIAVPELTAAQQAEAQSRLQKMQQAYGKEVAGLKTNIAQMKQRLAQPQAQQAVKEIGEAIRQQVEVARLRIEDRKQRIDNLRTQSFVLHAAHASLQEAQRFARQQEKYWHNLQGYGTEAERLQLIPNPQQRLQLARALRVEVEYQRNGLVLQSKRLNRFRVREDFARNAARNVYTHGRYRKLYLTQVKETQRLLREVQAEPQHAGKQATLAAAQVKLRELEKQFAKEFSVPAAQRSIERMVTARMEKNELLTSRQQLMAEHAGHLDDLSRELRGVEQAAAKELAMQRQQQTQEVSLTKAIRNLLNIPEGRSMAGMSARLSDAGEQGVKDRALCSRYEYDF